ncbi:protein fem-1 homolog C [Folsomia candida]|uniref:Protein fem-1 C n=1 Tax=Folsomia candida TaxID=158441 RepID=A0A226EXU4_FOLCA|nr:protein fem-1 homolog C [Folsomia candida]XP_021943721.1 protein fem-1 homolog C [Folsomia candida]OXA61426.1 Protein fem-1 C [Folsomia candida]
MENQIFDAASHGKLSLIKDVLEKRPKSERIHLLSSKGAAGETPLILACRNGHYDVAEYLIKNCGADLELVGSVIFDGETIEGVPPLWCAAAAGNLKIVDLLVQNGANVNSTTRTNSTPLRAACFDGRSDVVKYLVKAGADIEIPNRHGHTCLMIACYKNHYFIAKYLLQQGADINRKSVKANTALHDCAESGALAILKLLLSKGAKFDLDSYGMSPILAASVAGNANIVEYLLSVPDLVMIKDKIAALELLGATFVDNKKDMTGALGFWRRAMELRYRNGQLIYPKPLRTVPVYEGRKEVDSLDELEELISDPDEMRMQSLMVRERVLGPAHPDTSYYIRYRGAVFADAGEFNRCVELWFYALNMQQRILEPLSPLTQGSLLSFAELFWFMMGDKKNTFFPVPVLRFEDAYMVFCKSVQEIEAAMKCGENNVGIDKVRDAPVFHRLLVITLQICSVLLAVDKTPEEDYKFRKTAYHLVKMGARGTGGWSLLHIASSNDSTVGRFSMKIFPSIKTIEFLSSVGGDLTERDDEGNTPLHLVAEAKSCSAELVKSLLNCGAHLDEVNNAKETFETLSKEPLHSLVDPIRYQSLKCLAARVVSQNQLQGCLPAELLSFIKRH